MHARVSGTARKGCCRVSCEVLTVRNALGSLVASQRGVAQSESSARTKSRRSRPQMPMHPAIVQEILQLSRQIDEDEQI